MGRTTGVGGRRFAETIKTPAGIQAALERCDGNPEFETALANWLERTQPQSPEQRDAIRKTSLRLLEDTSDSQVALALLDGMIRQALNDVNRNTSVPPKQAARTLYADIARATGRQPRKSAGIALLTRGLAEDGAVTASGRPDFAKALLSLTTNTSARPGPKSPPVSASADRP